MKIGLLSDSHGRAETTRHAVDLLMGAGARVLVHLGDIGSLGVIDALVAPWPGDPNEVTGATGGRPRQVEAHLVFGNCDWDTRALTRYAQSLGIHVDHPVGRLDVAGRQLTFLHGHDGRAMTRALGEQPAYLCHGHTHQRRDARQGPTRLINPGALVRARRYTVALLDAYADRLTFLDVKSGQETL